MPVIPITTYSYRRLLVALLLLMASTFSSALAANSCLTTFFQTVVVNHSRIFDEVEILSFQRIMEVFADSIAGSDATKIMTSCTVLSQFIMAPNDGQHSLNQIEYALSWSSDTVDVSLHGEEFKDNIGEDLEVFATILIDGGLDISEANRVFIIGQTLCESAASPALIDDFPVDSDEPTALPSFSAQVHSEAFFLQNFTVSDSRSFEDDGIVSFERIMEGYTANFSDIDSLIDSSCKFIFQRFIESEKVISVGYSMSWTSIHLNVTFFSIGFETFMNRNFDLVAKQMRNSGLSVVDVGLVFRYADSFPPSVSPVQSSIFPSRSLSFSPSTLPSYIPSTGAPSFLPSTHPSSHLTATMSIMPNALAPAQLGLTVRSSTAPKNYVLAWIPCMIALAHIC